MNDDFRNRWLARFGLPADGWRDVAAQHLAQLPFTDPRQTAPLIDALFEWVPALLRRNHDTVTAKLAEAFAWCCFSFWQCGSGMPAFPETYALGLKRELFRVKGRRDQQMVLLATLIVSDGNGVGQCGFNRLHLSDPCVVRESERLMLRGGYEFYLNAQVKYDEFEGHLKHSEEFRRDWKLIKRRFPPRTRSKEIIHRSLLPERNWERGAGARFDSVAQRFQATFDLFCWKYYLWGMLGEQPLLMKPSVVFTPLGTQIFIPGYLSFDGKRDLSHGEIARLHRARGVVRQGEGFSESRTAGRSLKIEAKKLSDEAKKLNLRGVARYKFITTGLRLIDSGDYRQVRKLLQN